MLRVEDGAWCSVSMLFQLIWIHIKMHPFAFHPSIKTRKVFWLIVNPFVRPFWCFPLSFVLQSGTGENVIQCNNSKFPLTLKNRHWRCKSKHLFLFFQRNVKTKIIVKQSAVPIAGPDVTSQESVLVVARQDGQGITVSDVSIFSVAKAPIAWYVYCLSVWYSFVTRSVECVFFTPETYRF